MAKKRLDIFIRAKDETKNAVKSAKSGFEGLSGTIKTLGAAWLTVRGLNMAADLVKLGAQAEQTEVAFGNLADSVGADSERILADLKEAAGGTISEMKLMQQSAQAVNLGLPLQDLAEMMEIARAAAAATGQSVEFMFDSIVSGTARQSKLILDNLGIIIDQTAAYGKEAQRLGRELSETEKRQVFLNEVLSAGQTIIENVGDATESTATEIQALGAAFDDFKVELGKVGAEILVETDALEAMSTTLRQMPAAIQVLIDAWNVLSDVLLVFQQRLSITNQLFEKMPKLIEDVKVSVDGLFGSIRQLEEVDLSALWKQLSQPPSIDPLAPFETDTLLDIQNQVEAIFEGSLSKQLATKREHAAAIEAINEEGFAQVTALMMKETKEFTKQEGIRFQVDKELTQAGVDRAIGAFNVIMDGQRRLTDGMVDLMFGARVDLAQIFKGIASDFIKMFIAEVTKAIVIAVAKWVALLIMFDKPANDRAAMQSGMDFARFFSMGVDAGLDRAQIDQHILGLASPQTSLGLSGGSSMPIMHQQQPQIVVNIQGNVIGEDAYVRDRLLPAIANVVSDNKFTANRLTL